MLEDRGKIFPDGLKHASSTVSSLLRSSIGVSTAVSVFHRKLSGLCSTHRCWSPYSSWLVASSCPRAFWVKLVSSGVPDDSESTLTV